MQPGRHPTAPRTGALHRLRVAALVAVLATGIAAADASAEPAGIADEAALSVSVQYHLILKILQFDRNLASRAGSEVVIAVVYQGRYRASAHAREEVHRAAEAAAGERVADRPVRLVDVDVDQVDLREALKSAEADVAYVAPLRAMDIAVITRVTRELRVATVTGVEDYVHDGVSVGLGVWQEKPRVLVNLDASKAEGVDFSSRLLSIARLVK